MDPDHHWYLDGYSLLAAPFTAVTRANPFLIPDLLLLLAVFWMVVVLAGRLAPAWPHARLAGALAFVVTTVLPRTALNVWVTPWTTTPVAALNLGCLLATLAFLDRPRDWRMVLLAALCAAAITAFRPADAVVIAAVCGIAMVACMGRGWRDGTLIGDDLVRNVAAGLGGGLLVLAACVALYVGVHGWRLSGYLSYSAALGFEWRIVPLQWVTIVLGPRPLLPEGNGLVGSFPWIMPGLAGMAACLAAPPWGGRRSRHALVIAAAAACTVQYLAYRDLHPQGLWQYYNYHYFKWLLPIFGLYAVLLAGCAVQRRWAGLAAGAVALALLLPWRPVLSVRDQALPRQAGRTVTIPAGLTVRDGLLIPAEGTFDTIYHGTHNYYYGENDRQWFGAVGRFVLNPMPGGLMLTPLFPVPPGPGKVVFDTGVLATDDVPLRLARMVTRYGVPCWIPRWLGRGASCNRSDPIPAPEQRAGEPVLIGPATTRLLLPYWSAPEGDARWTVFGNAGIRIRLAPPGTASAIRLQARAFVPPGQRPLLVSATVNGVPRASWTLPDETEQELRIPLPPGAIRPDGTLQLDLRIINPRAASRTEQPRGLRVESMTADP